MCVQFELNKKEEKKTTTITKNALTIDWRKLRNEKEKWFPFSNRNGFVIFIIKPCHVIFHGTYP